METRTGPERWDERVARDVLAAWRKSGESAREFGRARGIDPQRLHWWRKKLERPAARPRRRRGPRATAIRLVPAVVTDAGVAPASVVVRIGVVRIDVVDSARVAASWIAELIGALDRRG
jgi:hypothetical protein